MLALMFYLGKVMYGGSYGKDVDTFSSPQQALGVFKAMFDKTPHPDLLMRNPLCYNLLLIRRGVYGFKENKPGFRRRPA
jgi:hypothetical protein